MMFLQKKLSDEKPGSLTGQVGLSAGLSARAPDLVCLR